MIRLTLLPGVDTVIIKKDSGAKDFITTPDSFIVRKDILMNIILGLLKQEIINEKVLEGLLEDYNSV
jgi:hypothetical protein